MYLSGKFIKIFHYFIQAKTVQKFTDITSSRQLLISLATRCISFAYFTRHIIIFGRHGDHGDRICQALAVAGIPGEHSVAAARTELELVAGLTPGRTIPGVGDGRTPGGSMGPPQDPTFASVVASGRVRRVSDSADSDSDAGYRRDAGYRPGALTVDPLQGSEAWLDLLVAKLRPVIVGVVAEHTAGLRPAESPAQTTPAVVPTARATASSFSTAVEFPAVVAAATARTANPTFSTAVDLPPAFALRTFPPPDSLELLASDEFEDEESADEMDVDVAQDPAPQDPMDDESPRGTELPQSLIDRVAKIFISHIGYDEVRDSPSVSESSKLFSTNERGRVEGPPRMPVDTQCQDRIKVLAAKRTWTAFPAAQEKLFRVPEDMWESLFKTPTISEETRNKVRAEQGLGEPLRRKLEEEWSQVDLAGRVGLKFSSVFLLAAESLLRAHQQLPEDTDLFTRQEVGSLLFLLGPLARLIYDQFARVTIKATQVRRDNVLDTFDWPTQEARSRLERLPMVGSDLFAGEFLTKLAEEVKRFQETSEAPLNPNHRRAPHPSVPRPGSPLEDGRPGSPGGLLEDAEATPRRGEARGVGEAQ